MTDTERIKIAQGKLAGKTARQIAADTGLSESSVERASKDPRTSLLIQRLKERDEAYSRGAGRRQWRASRAIWIPTIKT